jgi:hypothetical protein
VLADGKFTINLYVRSFGIFAGHVEEWITSATRTWSARATNSQRSRQKHPGDDSEISGFKGPVSDVLAGWLFAWLMQSDVITGAGPYTHTFDFLSATNQAVADRQSTSIETADMQVYKVLRHARSPKITISGGPNGPVAVRRSRSWSTGVFVARRRRRAPPALSAYTLLLALRYRRSAGSFGAAPSPSEGAREGRGR